MTGRWGLAHASTIIQPWPWEQQSPCDHDLTICRVYCEQHHILVELGLWAELGKTLLFILTASTSSDPALLLTPSNLESVLTTPLTVASPRLPKATLGLLAIPKRKFQPHPILSVCCVHHYCSPSAPLPFHLAAPIIL